METRGQMGYSNLEGAVPERMLKISKDLFAPKDAGHIPGAAARAKLQDFFKKLRP
jgi:hypothetical protein